MEKLIKIDNDALTLDVSIKTNKPCKFMVTAADVKPNSFYVMRYIDVQTSRTIFLSFPVSPKQIKLKVICVSKAEGVNFVVGVKEKPLKKYNIHIDENTKQFLDLAVPFCQVAGFEKPYPNGRVFQSKNKKFNIKYFPIIRDVKTGQMFSTPARIGHNSGIIEVAAAKFVGYTIPMRLMILLHEFSHKWKNPLMNLPISDEVGADIAALYVYLGLGFSKVDAIKVYASVFLKAQNDSNLDRMRKIMNYIQKFEAGEFAKIEK